MTCCRGAGLMPEGLPEYARNGWGHVGIPSGAAVPGRAHAQRLHHTGAGNGDCRKKICHLKKYFTILVIRDIPFWGSQSPFSISPYVFTQGHHIWVFFSQ